MDIDKIKNDIKDLFDSSLSIDDKNKKIKEVENNMLVLERQKDKLYDEYNEVKGLITNIKNKVWDLKIPEIPDYKNKYIKIIRIGPENVQTEVIYMYCTSYAIKFNIGSDAHLELKGNSLSFYNSTKSFSFSYSPNCIEYYSFNNLSTIEIISEEEYYKNIVDETIKVTKYNNELANK